MIDDESFQKEGKNEVKRQFKAMKCESDALSVSMAVKDVSRTLWYVLSSRAPSLNLEQIFYDYPISITGRASIKRFDGHGWI